MKIKRGSTSVRRLIFIADTSSTTGAGLANLVYNSSGLVAYYFAGDLSNEVQITLVTATLGTFASGGFVAVDNTNMPGWYEIGIPDAALDGGNEVAIQLRGATNMAPVNIYIELDAVDYQDSTAFGLSRIDAAVSSRMATYTQPTGFLAATFPTTVASPTNITSATGVTLAAVTHTGAVIPTVSTVTNGVTVTTNNDKTGYSLSQAFPSNFASLGINASGHVSRVTLVDTTTTNTDMRGTDNAALASNWTATRAGYLDGVLIASNYNQRTVSVTGSNHVAADVHEFQPGVITAGDFAAGAIDANALAADAATEIANAVAATQALSRLDSMIESDGAGQFRFDTIALSMGAGGGGGTDWTANERTAIRSILGIPTSGTTPTDPTVGILDTIRDTVGSIGLNVYPVSASTPERVSGTTLTFYLDESRSVSIVTDFTLTNMTLEFTVEDSRGNDVYVVADGSIVKSSQTATVPITSTVTGSLGQYAWSLRDITTGNSVIARGVLSVQNAASND